MRRYFRPGWLVALLAVPLLWWALKEVPLGDIWAVLHGLTVLQIGILLLINGGILMLFGLRWWLILRALGYRLPYTAIARYRLAAFGVSYFTPGPHFGGEPLQIFYPRRNHGVPGTTALAAITLDKVLELASNFGFLALGVGVVVVGGLFGDLAGTMALPAALGLLALPVGYLGTVWVGGRPLSRLAARLPARGWGEKVAGWVTASEGQMAVFCRRHPRVLAQAGAVSLLVWAALTFEYWLALRFLGLPLDLAQTIAVMTTARLALLTPLPGALGALEAGQVLAMEAMGFDPAFGLSISLVIRARDVAFGALGLWLGGAKFKMRS